MKGKVKIRVKDAEYALNVSGYGEKALFFIHGITTNSFIWQQIVPAFEKKYKCYAIDLLGCGDSSMSLKLDYSLNRQAGNINEIARKLDLKNINFVCHDVGGGIGQLLAVNYVDIVNSLTLINSVAYDYWPVQPISALRTPIIRQLAIATLDIGMLKLIISKGIFHKHKLTSTLLSQFENQMDSSEARKAFLHFARSLNNKELIEIEDKLKGLNIPVQIIRGDADVFLSREISNRLNKNIPNSRLETIYTGGHYLMIDEPELISNTISVFLDSIEYN